MRVSFGTTLFLIAAAAFGTADADGVAIGQECGVNGADFLNDTFTGDYRVSGETGCTIGSETGCYCAPILGDKDPLGPWIWQCNSVEAEPVPFGPAEGKICPAEIPVPVGYDEDINPLCDGTNPTGQADDPPCTYSDCDSGGDFSAVCGCVDVTFGQGEDNEGDLQWFCLHSTCDCGSTTSSAFAVATSGMLPLVFGTATIMALIW